MSVVCSTPTANCTYFGFGCLWSSRKKRLDNGLPSWGVHWCRHLAANSDINVINVFHITARQSQVSLWQKDTRLLVYFTNNPMQINI